MPGGEDIFEQIKIYLPKYLSPQTHRNLFEGLQQFPDSLLNGDNFYSNRENIDSCVLYQGDGIVSLKFANLKDFKFKEANGVVISNTCDVSLENERLSPSYVLYAPMMELRLYQKILLTKFPEKRVMDHISDVEHQRVTQLFFLPARAKFPENILFLDKITSCPNEFIERATLREKRLFTLSQYGHYLFMIKLSIHFTRLMDGVDRG